MAAPASRLARRSSFPPLRPSFKASSTGAGAIVGALAADGFAGSGKPVGASWTTADSARLLFSTAGGALPGAGLASPARSAVVALAAVAAGAVAAGAAVSSRPPSAALISSRKRRSCSSMTRQVTDNPTTAITTADAAVTQPFHQGVFRFAMPSVRNSARAASSMLLSSTGSGSAPADSW